MTAWLILAACFVFYWPLRAEYLYETDSVNFALAIQEFNVAEHQPHPPGYPLWVLMVREVTWITGDPNTAMILLSICFTAGAAVSLYSLARRLQGRSAAGSEGRWGAAFITGLFLVAPNVIVYSTVATSYTVELFISSFVGWLAARLWEGDKRLAPLAAGALGLLAGVRLSGAAFMAPLLAYALWKACRLDWRSWVNSALLFAGAVTCWFIPAAYLNGGPVAFWKLNSGMVGFLYEISVFAGDPDEPPLERMIVLAVWCGMLLVVPLCFLLVAWLLRKCTGRECADDPHRPVWHHWWFYTLWLAPNFLVVLLSHCPKPCYLNLSLPPVLLCLGNLLFANCRALASSRPDSMDPGGGSCCLMERGPAAMAFGGYLLASVLLTTFPFCSVSFPWFSGVRYAFHLATLNSPKESDRAVGELIALTKAHSAGRYRGPPGEQMLVCMAVRQCGMNWEKASYYCRGCPSYLASHQGFVEFRERMRLHRPHPSVRPLRVRSEIRRIWWILEGGASAEEIVAAFPETRMALKGESIDFYVTDVGADPIDAEIRWGNRMLPLRRGEQR